MDIDYEFVDSMRKTLTYKKNVRREAVRMIWKSVPYAVAFLIAGLIFSHIWSAWQASYHRICQFDECVVTNFK